MEQLVESRFKNVERGTSISTTVYADDKNDSEYGFQWAVNTKSVFGDKDITFYGDIETYTVNKLYPGNVYISYNQNSYENTVYYEIFYDGYLNVQGYYVEYNGEVHEYQSDSIEITDESEIKAYVILEGNEKTGEIRIDLDSYYPSYYTQEDY